MSGSTGHEVRFDSVEQLREVYAREIKHGGVLLKAHNALVLFSEIDVYFLFASGSRFSVPGTVVNQVDSGYYIQFNTGEELTKLEAAVEYELALSKANDEEQQGVPEPEVSVIPKIAKPAWELIDPTSDVPLYKQLSQLSTREKMKLAKFANHPVRRILIRDAEKRIHMNIVQNPKISDVEMIEYTGIATISPGAIRWISTQLKYMKLPQVIQNLVSNPMTPTDLALKLLSKLTVNQLQKLARSHGVRESICRAARKKLANRTKD